MELEKGEKLTSKEETEKSHSRKLQDVPIPNSDWLTVREGAAYVRMGYARFNEAVKSEEIPIYFVPASDSSTGNSRSKRRRVHKHDLDDWMFGSKS